MGILQTSFQSSFGQQSLYDAAGRRKVGRLLELMGEEHVATYDSFTWAAAVPAVVADAENGIAARAGIPAEDRYDIDTVLRKFDEQFGVHKYRSIKSQEFLRSERRNKSMMSFIADLKNKAKHCEYGEKEERMVIDMIINKCKNSRMTEKLMELATAISP